MRKNTLLPRHRKEGKKCLFNDALNTLCLQLHGIRPFRLLLLLISSKDSFISERHDSTYVDLCLHDGVSDESIRQTSFESDGINYEYIS